jgi:hypothetical protein
MVSPRVFPRSDSTYLDRYRTVLAALIQSSPNFAIPGSLEAMCWYNGSVSRLFSICTLAD